MDTEIKQIVSSDEDRTTSSGGCTPISDIQFASALSQCGKDLLQKSQTPEMKKRKRDAVKEVIIYLMINYGIDATEKQINKKLQNMKQHVKHKTDRKATGNRKILLNAGEKMFFNLLGAEDNPAISRIKCAVSAGVNRKIKPECNEIALDDPGEGSSMHNQRSSSGNAYSPPRRVSPVAHSPVPPVPSQSKNHPNIKRPEQQRTPNEMTITQLQRQVLMKQLETLEQQQQLNVKLEEVLTKAGHFFDNYNKKDL